MSRYWWRKLDYVLIFLMVILVVYGIIIIYSANYQDPEGAMEYRKQIVFFFIGIALMAVFAAIDYKVLISFELYFYIFTLLILLAVIFFGHEALGAQRWIRIGFFSFQPSEFAKIFITISLAARLSQENALKSEKLAGTFLYLGVPMILIIMQPDLGTSLVLVTILFLMLFVRGFKPLYLAGIFGAGCAVLPFILKDYQKQRLLTFIHPEADPTGSGWNIIQSIVSIGSGKLWGKGLFYGTQTQLHFVPEHSTDFIFAVLGEELGFVGGASLILLYFFFLWKVVRIAKESKDLAGSLIAVGISGMFFFHIFVNMGMTMGVMPVTGVPLPFISYGGSALMTNMVAVGILLGIALRQEHFFK